jgi:GNAT superfamily N-acetyltransferase
MKEINSTVIVRLVQQADFPAWSTLWEGYNAFYGRSGPTALPAEITQMTWSRFFDVYEPMQAFVAECDGVVVGLAHIIFHRNTTLIAPICYLQDLFTVASVRGKGIGRALIDAVYDYAKEAGSTRVYWQTHETNQTAMALYNQVAEKSGFVVYRKSL